MTNLLKKLISIGTFCLFLTISLEAQVVVLQYRAVPQQNIADFIHRETTYWSQVAKKAIDEGKMLRWELWQRIGGYDLNADAHNFVFVNVYKDKYGLDEDIWDVSSVFRNIRIQDMETTTLGRTIHQVVVELQASAGVGNGRYAKMNYANVSNMDNFLKFEQETWQPFINKAIIEGKTSFVSWNLATVVTPTGSDIPFNAITVDHFDTYSEAVIPRWSDDLVTPDIEPSLKDRDRIMAQIYGLIMTVE